MLRAPGLITVRAVPNVQHHGQIRSDAALLNAHIAGDRYAFGELYLRHQVQLHQLARLRSQTAEDAEDAVQDAMLAAHRSAGAFRHDSAVSSWLHRIVVNACIDRTRRNRWPTTEITEHSAVIHDPASELDTRVEVHRALLRLPCDQRAALVAVDMVGYSVADAAKLFGVAEGTVKSRRARARSRLAGLLNPK